VLVVDGLRVADLDHGTRRVEHAVDVVERRWTTAGHLRITEAMSV